MIAFKGFNKDLTCRGLKFNIFNITDQANCRQNGFHCAENPLDCLSYYPDWEESVYYKVLASGDINEDGNDSKISCTELTLLEKLDVEKFVYESLKYMFIHPFREWSNKVCADRAEVKEGFMIVRGKKHLAKGKIGVTIGFAQEEENTKKIMLVNQFKVDGKDVLPDVWYDILGNPVSEESEGDL